MRKYLRVTAEFIGFAVFLHNDFHFVSCLVVSAKKLKDNKFPLRLVRN